MIIISNWDMFIPVNAIRFINRIKINKLPFVAVLFFLIVFLPSNVSSQRKLEKLGRGVVAINKGGGNVYISWRLLASDPSDISFNLYRSIGGAAATKINTSPIVLTTGYTDNSASTTQTNTYFVKPVINGNEQAASGSFTLPAGAVAKSFITIKLNSLPRHFTNHIYVGDLNGDGEYDYVVKRFPAYAEENIFFEAYLNDGTFLWRIDLGPNIEQGNSAYNPIALVHDFTGNGKAEVVVMTSEGTKFANGYTIPDVNGDGVSDYRTFPPVSMGYMLLGDNCPEFLSMIDGLTGEEITRTEYIDRGPKANWTALWGDSYGHRMNMNFIGVAYLDGINPSIVISRGDGGVMDVQALDISNNQFVSRWTWSARTNTALPAGKTWKQFHLDWLAAGAKITGIPSGYHWADFHNIRVVDLDGDGKDEISWGVNAMDDNGTPLYFAKNDIGHGDRFVIADIDPDRPGLECYAIQQTNSVLSLLYDAKTGERIKTWSTSSPFDVGRGDVADIDPRYKGLELWSYAHPGLLNCKGTQIANSYPHPALSIWWDGDLLRENLDAAGKEGYNPIINKWDYNNGWESRLISLYNEGGDYTTRCPYAGRVALYGDIMGDWREEIFLTSADSTEIRIFSTSIPASRRLYTLMQNPEYRNCINLKAYLPSTEVDYYLGTDMSEPPLPPTITMKRQWKGGLNNNSWDINSTPNWLTNDNQAVYSDGDSVMFDINGTGNTVITLSGELSPAYTVVNSPVNYTFGGTGKITGTTNLIKSGKGYLNISSNCDYTGNTRVDEGTLLVDSSLVNSIITVYKNAAIGGKGKIFREVNLAQGASIIPGAENITGTLTFGNGLTFTGHNSCLFDITDDSTGFVKPSDKIMVTGNLVINDTTFFKINKTDNTVKPGSYPLISYSGAFTGNLKKVSVLGMFGQKIALKDSLNTIWLEVIASRGASKVVWAGNGDKWDLLTSPNWLYNGISDIFAANDSVVFNEIGSGQYNVNLVGDLPIKNMVVETDANNYYFDGIGVIGGTGGITKNGAGILSIANTNNIYTGKTVINHGTFILGGLNNAGFPSSIGASSITSASNIVFNNTKIQYLKASDTYTDRGITLSGTQDTLEIATAGKIVTLSGLLAGSAKLVKTGSGTLYITNNSNTYSGGTVIKQGIIQINDPATTIAALGPGAVTLDGGTLLMGNGGALDYTTANMNFIVPEGSVGTLSTDQRCNFYGSLTGGGTLNLYLPGTIDRTIFFGNWSAFYGKINVTCTPSGSRFRLATTAYSNAEINLGANVTMYHSTGTTGGDGTATNVNIGALSGISGSYLTDENWVIGAKNINTVFSGTISGYSLTKVGTGMLTLSGANTYAGGTYINNGTMLVTNTTGSATGTGSLYVNNNGVLSGTGIVGSPVVVNNGGCIAPGNAYGTLTVNNNVTIQSGGVWKVDVNMSSGISDKILVNSSYKLTINGGTLDIVNNGATPFADGNSIVITYATNISGAFANILPSVPAEGLKWDTTEFRSSGKIKVVQDVPDNIQSIDVVSDDIQLFPNPNNGVFYITTAKELKNTKVIIENINGMEVFRRDYKVLMPNTEVNMGIVPKGLYMIKIQVGSKQFLKKMVVN